MFKSLVVSAVAMGIVTAVAPPNAGAFIYGVDAFPNGTFRGLNPWLDVISNPGQAQNNPPSPKKGVLLLGVNSP